MPGYSGGTSAQDLLRLRRMVAEPTSATYSDGDLAAAIERYPIADVDGYWPEENDWLETYDLARAAAEIWEEKAAAVASNFAFDADGASFQKQQQYEQYAKQARLYNSRRTPGAWTAETVTADSGESLVGNWNDPYE